MTVSANAKFIFKWCSCRRVCRGSEWRKHIKDAASVAHDILYRALVCTTCKEMCTEVGNIDFLSKHKSCLQKKSSLEEVKAYLSTVKERLEGRTEDEVAVDDIDPISEHLTSSESVSEADSEESSSEESSSEEEEEEEEVAAAPEVLQQLPSEPLASRQDLMEINWDEDDFVSSTPFDEVRDRNVAERLEEEKRTAERLEEERRAAEKEEERRAIERRKEEEKKAEVERRKEEEKKVEAERRKKEEEKRAEAERRKKEDEKRAEAERRRKEEEKKAEVEKKKAEAEGRRRRRRRRRLKPRRRRRSCRSNAKLIGG